MVLDADSLNPTDRAVLTMLREGRCTAGYIAAETGYTRGNVRNRLVRLMEHGHVERVHEGLYELVSDPLDESPGSEPEPGTGTREDRSTDEIDELLAEFTVGRNREEREARRESAKAALRHLRADGEMTAADFKRDVYPEHGVEAQSESTWWTRTVRGSLSDGEGGALALAVAAGLVEKYDSEGKPTYRWVGDSHE
jgi:DNA-binding transcriptional ArsR family regulator